MKRQFMLARLYDVPFIAWLGLLFVVAETLDLVSFLRAPVLERNLVPAMASVGMVYALKVAGVVAVLAGARVLEKRGRADAPILVMAQAVLVVGAAVGFSSFALNIISVGL